MVRSLDVRNAFVHADMDFDETKTHHIDCLGFQPLLEQKTKV